MNALQVCKKKKPFFLLYSGFKMEFSGFDGDKYRSYLSEEEKKNTQWRYGPPNYDVVNKLFEEGRTKVLTKLNLAIFVLRYFEVIVYTFLEYFGDG